MSGEIIIQKAGRGFLSVFSTYFKWGLMSIFLGIILLNAIIISIETGSVEPGMKDLGNRFFMVTKNINTLSEQVIEEGGIYNSTEGFWDGIFIWIKHSWVLFSNIYIVWLWIKVLSKAISSSPWSNVSMTFANYSGAILIFLFSQMTFIGYWAPEEGIMTPINAFINLGKALPYLISEAKTTLGPLDNLQNETASVTCNIINSTTNMSC